MKLDMFIVDAFTQEQFSGNSAAVVLLDEWLSKTQMQQIATENNLSETAFIKHRDSKNSYEIRWFSPLIEVDFCGHATLASAYVLFNQLNICGEIELVTAEVGNLYIHQADDGRIEMRFPNQCPQEISSPPAELLAGVSCKPVHILQNRQAYFIIVDSADEVRNTHYDSDKLKTLAPFDVVVTAQSDEKYDFVSRYFWPANGGDEDAVTGSIHAGLAPLWAEKLGKNELLAYQASQRGGVIFCRVDGASVIISGYAVLYLKGVIYI